MDNSQNDVTEWLWDFGDGVQSSGQHPKYTYFTKGTYSVSLAVKGHGGSSSIVKTDCVQVNDIKVDFTATPTTGLYPLTVSFTADMNTSSTQLTWDFGDGFYTHEFNPIHTYTQVGNYSISLIAHAETKDITKTHQNYIQVSGRQITPCPISLYVMI